MRHLTQNQWAHIVLMLLLGTSASFLAYTKGRMEGRVEGGSNLPTTPVGCPPYLFVNYRLRGQEILQGMRDNTRLSAALTECRRMNRPTEMDAGISGYPLIATELGAVTRELNACLEHTSVCDTVLLDCTNHVQTIQSTQNAD